MNPKSWHDAIIKFLNWMHNGDHADAKEETKNTTHITLKVSYTFVCHIMGVLWVRGSDHWFWTSRTLLALVDALRNLAWAFHHEYNQRFRHETQFHWTAFWFRKEKLKGRSQGKFIEWLQLTFVIFSEISPHFYQTHHLQIIIAVLKANLVIYERFQNSVYHDSVDVKVILLAFWGTLLLHIMITTFYG